MTVTEERTTVPTLTTTSPMRVALNAALRRSLEDDDRVVVMGEDVGTLGGVFRVTDGLKADFGERVMDSPLAESGIIGSAIGLALRGYRPVCEIQFDGFVYPAFDQIVSQLAKMRARSGGRIKLPVTVRIPCGGGIGAVEHHSESNEAYFCHTAGLRVVACGNPQDAYDMLRASIASDDPVIFFEPKKHYWDKAELDLAGELRPSSIESARLMRRGEDATLLAYGPTAKLAADAAEIASSEGRSLEVIDLRSLSPIDLVAVCESVRRTGRLVIVHEAPVFAGLGAEIAASVGRECFYELEAPIERVGGYDVPYPPARCEADYLPDVDRVLDAVDKVMNA